MGGLNKILQSPWFKRLWVVQEVSVAQEIVMRCGWSSFSWKNSTEQVVRFSRDLKAAAIRSQLDHGDTIDFDPFIKLLQMQLEVGPRSAVYMRNRPAADLLDVAYEMRDRQCADPRDRIYGCMGMVGPSGCKGLQVDYSQSVEDTFEYFESLMLQPRSSDEDILRNIDSDHIDLDTLALIRGQQLANAYHEPGEDGLDGESLARNWLTAKLSGG